MANPSITVQIGASLSGLQAALQNAQAQLQNFGRNVSNRLSSISSSITDANGRFQQFGETSLSLGKVLSVGLTAPITALGVASIKTFGDIEALKKGLIAVMGSSEAAESEFKKLIEVAKLPGLGLEEAARGSVSLQSAGFSADEARKSLLAFGNALATVGKGKNELNFVILALTQLQNKTSGFGQDLRQLVEQLPQLRGALTNAFGTADSEAIAKLGVTGKEVVEILTTEFAKLPKVTGGIKNAFENFSDSTKIAFSSVGESINKAFDIGGLIGKVSSFIESLAKSFAELDTTTQKIIIVFAGLAAGIGPLLLGIGGIISALPLLIAGFTALSGPIGIIGIAVVGLTALIVTNFDQVKYQFKITLLEIITFSQTAIKALDLVSGAVPGFKAITTGALLSLESLGRSVAESLVNDFGVEAVKGLEEFQNQTTETVTAVSKGLGLIGGLTAQINTLNEQRDLAKDQNEVNLITAKVSALQDQLALINAIAKRSAEPVKSEVGVLAPRDNPFAGGLPFADSKASKSAVTQGVQTAPTAQMIESMRAGREVLANSYAEMKAQAEQFNQDISDIINNGAANTLGNFAFSIGDALASGGDVLKAAGASLLDGLASVLNQLGQLAIATGIGIKGIKTALKTLNPAVAIGAGVALVALAGFVSSKAKSLGGAPSASGGGGGSVGSGVSGQSFTGTGLNAMQSMNIGGEFTVKGSDLVFVLSQEEKKRNKG